MTLKIDCSDIHKGIDLAIPTIKDKVVSAWQNWHGRQ